METDDSLDIAESPTRVNAYGSLVYQESQEDESSEGQVVGDRSVNPRANFRCWIELCYFTILCSRLS